MIFKSPLLIYTIRCVIGFVIGYGFMHYFPELGPFWTLLSIMLVISPEGKDTKKLTLDRVRSNFIGSIVGLVCHYIPLAHFPLLLLGIIITIITCYRLHVMNMSRVAIVAFLIVMLQPISKYADLAPIIRFLTVAIGCLIGLMITVVTYYLFLFLDKKWNAVKK